MPFGYTDKDKGFKGQDKGYRPNFAIRVAEHAARQNVVLVVEAHHMHLPTGWKRRERERRQCGQRLDSRVRAMNIISTNFSV